jgi:hypothetical protein
MASAAALLLSVILGVLAGPGKRPPLSSDPRAVLCGDDCFPVSHPWLLIVAAAFAIAGLVGLRAAFKRSS